jgi:hypothetical protein
MRVYSAGSSREGGDFLTGELDRDAPDHCLAYQVPTPSGAKMLLLYAYTVDVLENFYNFN